MWHSFEIASHDSSYEKNHKTNTNEQLKRILELEKKKNDALYTEKSIRSAVYKLLNRFRDTEENLEITEKLQFLTYNYRNEMEAVITTLEKIANLNLEARIRIQKTEKEFHLLSQATTSVNLLSWTVDILMVLSMPFVLKFSWNPRTLVLLSSVVGSLSICGSLFAFSHAKRKIEDMSKILRQDKSYILKLKRWLSKSMKIDEEIRQLFPHGINNKLIDQNILDGNKPFKSELSWKEYVCSIIILSNVRQDAKLLTDEGFLTTVKLFVESPAAHIWWNRLRIHKLMDGIIRRTKNDPDDILASCSEFFQRRATVSLIPVTIPLMIAPVKHDKVRIILCAMGAALAAFDLFESKDEAEFEELKIILKIMKKEYGELERILMTIDPEYD